MRTTSVEVAVMEAMVQSGLGLLSRQPREGRAHGSQRCLAQVFVIKRLGSVSLLFPFSGNVTKLGQKLPKLCVCLGLVLQKLSGEKEGVESKLGVREHKIRGKYGALLVKISLAFVPLQKVTLWGWGCPGDVPWGWTMH